MFGYINIDKYNKLKASYMKDTRKYEDEIKKFTCINKKLSKAYESNAVLISEIEQLKQNIIDLCKDIDGLMNDKAELQKENVILKMYR